MGLLFNPNYFPVILAPETATLEVWILTCEFGGGWHSLVQSSSLVTFLCASLVFRPSRLLSLLSIHLLPLWEQLQLDNQLVQ